MTTVWQSDTCPAADKQRFDGSLILDPDNDTWDQGRQVGSTYTPVADDNDACLRVKVSYTDRMRDTNNDAVDTDRRYHARMFAQERRPCRAATAKVQNKPRRTTPPKFASARYDARYGCLEENAKALS